jgi:hypothetical protein
VCGGGGWRSPPRLFLAPLEDGPPPLPPSMPPPLCGFASVVPCVQALIGCGTAIKALVAQVEKPETESLWQEATSPDGKTYYWHTVTKFVSWVKPSELGGTVGDKVWVWGLPGDGHGRERGLGIRGVGGVAHLSAVPPALLAVTTFVLSQSLHPCPPPTSHPSVSLCSAHDPFQQGPSAPAH